MVNEPSSVRSPFLTDAVLLLALLEAGALFMVTRVATVAFNGIEAVPVDVQVQIAPVLSKFLMVGLPDKAVK